MTHPSPKRNKVPKATLMRSSLVSLTTARTVNTAQPRTTVNNARPMTIVFNKAHSTVRMPINNKTTTKNINFNKRVNTISGKNVNTTRLKVVVNAARPKAVLNAIKGNQVNDVKASACWVWKPKTKGNLQMDLQDQGVIDSGCSRHMTWNMSYLTNFEEIDGGYVAFGGNSKGGKIIGRCTIKTGNLDFENNADLPFSQSSKSSPDDGSKPSGDDEKKVTEEAGKEGGDPSKEGETNDQEKKDNFNSTNTVNVASTNKVNAIGAKTSIELLDDLNMPELEDIVYSNNDEDVGAEADMNNLDAFMHDEPKKVIHALKDPIWIEAMQKELLQFKLQEVWTLVELPNGKRAIRTKWVFRNKKDERGIVIKNKARLMDVKSAFLYDDIIFGSTKKSLCTEFEKMMHKKFQMRSMGELTFFLGLQTASTPIETQKLLLNDEDVCACVRYQANPKVSHFHAVKRIFRYLKGQHKLGLWYPKDSPFDLVTYTDSDYAGASLDRKFTTGGCQFLGSRLISWQCKKQIVVANSTTEAEYVAASSCCR
ncbi:hypothetical protein Tco_0086562 [Tanacetum coccineum]